MEKKRGHSSSRKTECPKRIIPCTLGCKIDDLWAQDEEQHKTHECPKRLLPCILKCKLMIPEDEMVKHVRKFPVAGEK